MTSVGQREIQTKKRFVTGASVKIGYFETDSNLRYHDEVHGDLFTQVDRGMDLLLTKYLKALISYEGIQRIETYPVPEEALREALLNAIAHKDYGSGIPIQVSVYDNKVMLWNPGQLPPNWTVEQLTEKHSSRPFNPDIANAFFRSGMIEAWGRGIERILQTCAAATVPQPVLLYDGSGIWVKFEKRALKEGAGETLEKTPGKTPDRILAWLRKDPNLTISELAELTGKSTSTVERAIRKLRKAGRLERIGPAKGGRWHVIGSDDE